jgi:hypothetical protein
LNLLHTPDREVNFRWWAFPRSLLKEVHHEDHSAFAVKEQPKFLSLPRDFELCDLRVKLLEPQSGWRAWLCRRQPQKVGFASAAQSAWRAIYVLPHSEIEGYNGHKISHKGYYSSGTIITDKT